MSKARNPTLDTGPDFRLLSPYCQRLTDHWDRQNPEWLTLSRDLASQPVTAQRMRDAWQAVQAPSGMPVEIALPTWRNIVFWALCWRDASGAADLQEICMAMTEMAAQAIQIALTHARAQLAPDFGQALDGQGQAQDLLVVGMGKLGGHELNVSSDIDLVFVHREQGQTDGVFEGASSQRSAISAHEYFEKLGRAVIRLLSDTGPHGFVFRVDMRLRPFGDSGPLVVSLPALEEYLVSQGREWERFAWLKSRIVSAPLTASAALWNADAQALRAIVEPFVYRRYFDFSAIASLRDLHQKIRHEANARERRAAEGIDVKLGRGGIREIEFAAQLFQIIRGGRDAALRSRSTLKTLQKLGERGSLTPSEASELGEDYCFLRRVEHAIQFKEDQQTHRLLQGADERERVAQFLRMPGDELQARLQTTRERVAGVFERLLTAPESEGPTLTASEAVDARLQRLRESLMAHKRYLGAREPTQQLAIRLLERAASQPDARRTDDAGLLRFSSLLETVLGRPGYLTFLDHYPAALERLIRLLSASSWAAQFIARHPVVLDELLSSNLMEDTDYIQWRTELGLQLRQAALPDGTPDLERQLDLLREAKHGQILRLLARDLEGKLSVERLSDHLSAVADSILSVCIDLAWATLRSRHRDSPQFAVIAYGKLGGKELGYASDLDLVFVFQDDDARAQENYALLARKLSSWLSTQTGAGHLYEVDLRLRPNGDAGLLVTSMAAFDEYQRQQAWVWEHQALTRARFAAGDAGIGARFERVRAEVLQTARSEQTLHDEVLAMRKKMRDGHPNRTALFDVKHDAGGMVDIEFMVQYLVLLHARTHPELVPNLGNIALLKIAANAGLIETQAAQSVGDAYRAYRAAQHRLRLNDAEFARVPEAEFTPQREAVTHLWKRLFHLA